MDNKNEITPNIDTQADVDADADAYAYEYEYQNNLAWVAGVIDNCATLAMDFNGYLGVYLTYVDPDHSAARLERFSGQPASPSAVRHGRVQLTSTRVSMLLVSARPYMCIKAVPAEHAIRWVEYRYSTPEDERALWHESDTWWRTTSATYTNRANFYWSSSPRPDPYNQPPPPSLFWPYMAGALEPKVKRGRSSGGGRVLALERINKHIAWWLLDLYNSGRPARALGPKTIEDILTNIQPYVTKEKEGGSNDNETNTEAGTTRNRPASHTQEVDESTP